ncbi:MAG TPA: hypothetical protein VJO34_11100 [Methylomirabilota bacterium]|nr:hypothetical protein [Methylomirabilota bacterium]
MSIPLRIAVLTGALLLVELASFFKLSRWLFWSNYPWLAYTSALAFVVLLLAAIIAIGSDISSGVRRQFYIGGIWLFAIQGLANCLISYELSLVALPVEVVTAFFNVNEDFALKSMSVLQGATLSVASITFWRALGELLRNHWDHQRQTQHQLQDWGKILQEVSDE